MAQLSITSFVTLDGVMQAPGGPTEDPSGGFELGGWSVPYGDDDFGRFISEVFERAGAFLLGRRTYEIFAGYWPKVTDPADPVASRLNSLPKYVVSTTLEKADWEGTTIVRGDLAKEIAALKERTDGELQVHGSGALAHFLMAHDLIDTFNVLTFPVVLGTGRRLFANGAVPTAFRHTGARTTAAGVAINTYELAGRPEYGTY
ncbi:dihydrofolate reductase family protein [Streptomyces lunaelactis]|uniref:dihydrofolate reductase family protein n=1 Tax=Streptomyces lunaelactis TaxID=1535768 RepID=UPI0015849151|nr:dihydrofolate reductase family protein [Streptomyces lunaelactis]NUK04460.1 dihydrofolate reductase family protein [Streptomyces lunaelactis]NUK11238.1 dihydrofolate reductase family protein [Streptomyces lunaelactis]NUK19007.1 dihydrofolate reductase family protein [Streptomyces lunaelactis]NUK26277.1 dihydrofolate reductase family protein [Streptomyces lunaelactis]NUK53944.1 dihydrofolate reductase family protein [Streptomyces lunaelactis]